MNLTNKDREVLAVLDEQGGQTTSSTLKNKIEWIEQSSQSSYRIDKLQDFGLVDATDGVVGAKATAREVTLTDKGRETIEKLDIGPHQPTLERRVERLEAQNKKMENYINAQTKVLLEVERIFDDLGVEYSTQDVMRDHL